MTSPASSTLTFLFTDIEGSTRLWERSPAEMRVALARHDALLREAIERNGGAVFKTVGDAFCAAFRRTEQALAAARAGQLALAREPWPDPVRIKVRMALHTGAVEVRGDDYFGQALNRVARLLAAGHGGQVLLSLATHELVRDDLPAGTRLRDMGERRLKDLIRPERIYQLVAPELPGEFPPLKTLDARAHNLPIQLTSFVGRDREMQEVKSLVKCSRLVTLTGAGGAGKTRLALQAGADRIDDYADGVWLAELAPLTDPGLVTHAAATVLGITEEPGVPLITTLIRELKDRELLLLLDNCEHLIDASAELCQALLGACGNVRILASSREALRVPGEATYRVPSLAAPDPKANPSIAALTQYAAVRLFIDRALAVQPTFEVTNVNAPAVASLCYHLDGIPLAIELAAARVRSMSVQEVNERLDQRFRLLTDGARRALPRHQTLRSAIDWSYELLNAAEKALFRRLAVFAGGWTLKAAEAVCAAIGVEEAAVLDILVSLVDKSLALAEQRNGATRYRLLETVREYAVERLRESGEEAPTRARHLAHFVSIAEEAEQQLTGAAQKASLERLETEHDNLRAALASSIAAGGDAALGIRLAGALFRFWSVRGYLTQGRGQLSALIEATSGEKTTARAKALSGAGGLAWQQGDYAIARALHDECLAIRCERGDQLGVAASLSNLGIVAYDQGDYAEARDLLERSLSIQRELGNKRGIAASLNNLGIVASDARDFAGARRLHEECLAIERELGNRRGMAMSLNNLAAMANEQGDYTAARALHEESLAIFRELGDRPSTADVLNNLGNVAREQNDHRAAAVLQKESLAICLDLGDRRGVATALEALADVTFARSGALQAAPIWGRAELLREEIGSTLRPGERPHRERRVAAARAAARDDAAFDRAWQSGRALSLQQAIDCALEALAHAEARTP